MAIARALAVTTSFAEADNAATVQAGPPSRDALPLDIHVIIRRSINKTPGQISIGNTADAAAQGAGGAPAARTGVKAGAGGVGAASLGGAGQPYSGGNSTAMPQMPPGPSEGNAAMSMDPSKASMPAFLPAPPAVPASRPLRGPPPRQDYPGERAGAARAGAFL
mmetsp:Transcript_6149/g.19355  ORF Transcript_6149/g.19355 Transcript_6149/m.19355 type:complete len:164 (-) Transcript_6149:22-513(-)